MVRTLGFGWIATFLLFLGFLGGAWYVWDTTRTASYERQYMNCVERVTSTDGTWKVRSQIALCQELYRGVHQAGGLGIYGPRSEATISLAMMPRPGTGLSYR